MEHGIPCVGTDEGGINDIIEDGKTGFVVPKGNAQALAMAVEKLIVDTSLCKTMGKAGRLKYLQKYTETSFERTMLNCLKNVMTS